MLDDKKVISVVTKLMNLSKQKRESVGTSESSTLDDGLDKAAALGAASGLMEAANIVLDELPLNKGEGDEVSRPSK